MLHTSAAKSWPTCGKKGVKDNVENWKKTDRKSTRLNSSHGDGVFGLVDLHINTRRNDDGFSSNSRHCLLAPFLPHKGEHFTADMGSAGSLVGHDAFGSGDDRGAQALHDLGHILAVGVGAQAGLGHAAQTSDNGLAVSLILQGDNDGALNGVVLDLQVYFVYLYK